MERLIEVSEILKEKLPNSSIYTDHVDWEYYEVFSGHYKDEYYDIYLRCSDSNPTIEICFTTDCKEYIEELLCDYKDIFV